ncbi:DUF979 domain-containing protein [Novosphingobium sp.]|uniref:DUF979 domain-containing protein n=1 Tax=Novosphingobium sp. TaxID=1874826 RepID=UPI0025F996C1|nr:DUF979 domain-containing protein [Novosphingobium sp.]MCC6924655.1 DUF979 domain-containing protein [Novosphingobium sp.]
MIGLAQVYLLAGLVFGIFAVLSARDASNPRRWSNAAFWALLALSMLAGDRLGDLGNGVLVLALVGIAGLGGMGRGAAGDDQAARAERAARHGNRLFLLALVIPLTALAGTFLFKQVPHWIDPKQVTLVSLALGALLGLAVGLAWLRESPVVPFQEGRRLMDAVGWAAVLPQMLASLGAVFALAGVGQVVGGLMSEVIPAGSLVGAVIAYGLGMALFTMVMGNAFAAFPVMAAAIGLPLLIQQYHGSPAVVAAVGMLCGFCGTLMTPMAANFNVVPAALLELRDRNAVVKAQVGTALPLLAFNVALIWWAAFP